MLAEPFEIRLSDAVLADLRRRLEHVRLPHDFANDDWSYGVNGAYLRGLVEYWRDRYDWRAILKRERLLRTNRPTRLTRAERP